MLVLARKNGQKIIVNDNIEITILDTKFDYCKIAIDAPKDVKIYREEVYKQIQASNRLSNRTSVDSIESIDSIIVDSVVPQVVKTNKIIIKKKEQ